VTSFALALRTPHSAPRTPHHPLAPCTPHHTPHTPHPHRERVLLDVPSMHGESVAGSCSIPW